MNFISHFRNHHRLRLVLLALFAARQMLPASEADQQTLVAANNAFALDLTAQVASAQPGDNVFLSPYSVSSALQMVGNGAAGQTQTEFQQVLHTTGLPPAMSNPAFKELNQRLTVRSNVTLDLANGIWFKQGFRLKPAFMAANRNFFRAQLAAVDFDNPQSAKTINDWASQQTHGKITGVVQYPFDPLIRVILANAIYFKGDWASPFDATQTKPRDFHLATGKVKPAPMMVQHRKFAYQETPGFQAVQLPYAGDLQMEVFLPATNSSPQKLLDSFKSPGNWSGNLQPAFKSREGTVVLPRFKMEFSVTLNSALKSLGLNRAFGADADFSALADGKLCISEVKQKSYVDVDEKGTEAAAVTTVGIRAMSIRLDEPPPFEMVMDRPFLFVIADHLTGSILFLGVVNDPAPGNAN